MKRCSLSGCEWPVRRTNGRAAEYCSVAHRDVARRQRRSTHGESAGGRAGVDRADDTGHGFDGSFDGPEEWTPEWKTSSADAIPAQSRRSHRRVASVALAVILAGSGGVASWLSDEAGPPLARTAEPLLPPESATWVDQARLTLASIDHQLAETAEAQARWRAAPRALRSSRASPAVEALGHREQWLNVQRAVLATQLASYDTWQRTAVSLGDANRNLEAVDGTLRALPKDANPTVLAQLNSQRDTLSRQTTALEGQETGWRKDIEAAIAAPRPDPTDHTAALAWQVRQLVDADPGGPSPSHPRPLPVRDRAGSEALPGRDPGLGRTGRGAATTSSAPPRRRADIGGMGQARAVSSSPGRMVVPETADTTREGGKRDASSSFPAPRSAASSARPNRDSAPDGVPSARAQLALLVPRTEEADGGTSARAADSNNDPVLTTPSSDAVARATPGSRRAAASSDPFDTSRSVSPDVGSTAPSSSRPSPRASATSRPSPVRTPSEKRTSTSLPSSSVTATSRPTPNRARDTPRGRGRTPTPTSSTIAAASTKRSDRAVQQSDDPAPSSSRRPDRGSNSTLTTSSAAQGSSPSSSSPARASSARRPSTRSTATPPKAGPPRERPSRRATQPSSSTSSPGSSPSSASSKSSPTKEGTDGPAGGESGGSRSGAS